MQSAIIMGINPDEFWHMCMVDFQNVKSAHYLKNGLKPDGGNPDTMDLSELDALKCKVKDKLKSGEE